MQTRYSFKHEVMKPIQSLSEMLVRLLRTPTAGDLFGFVHVELRLYISQRIFSLAMSFLYKTIM